MFSVCGVWDKFSEEVGYSESVFKKAREEYISMCKREKRVIRLSLPNMGEYVEARVYEADAIRWQVR